MTDSIQHLASINMEKLLGMRTPSERSTSRFVKIILLFRYPRGILFYRYFL